MSEEIKKYQLNKGLSTSGVIDRATYDALFGEQITYAEGKTGDDIKQYQLILFYTGYLNVYPSGYYGSVTTEAVIKYQKDTGRHFSEHLGWWLLSEDWNAGQDNLLGLYWPTPLSPHLASVFL